MPTEQQSTRGDSQWTWAEPESRVHVLPLGFGTGMEDGIRLAAIEFDRPRAHSWAFVGDLHTSGSRQTDRTSMLLSMQTSLPDGVAITQRRIARSEVFALYRTSWFVPIGRGRKVLDW